MPIKQIDDRLRVTIAGKIRLGERVVNDRGGMPKNVSYFNLADTPDVEKVYGANPTELHIQFISPDRNEAAPYWYKWYSGGFVDQSGERHGGDIMCRGDGVTAKHYAERDPVTGEVPERQCLHKDCPDWMRGFNRQCKEAMNIFFILPLVSSINVYQIDSTSKTNIAEFHSTLKFIEERHGRIDRFIYRIFRYQKDMEYRDQKTKELKKTKPWLLGLDIGYGFQDEFKEKLEAAEKYLISSQYEAPRVSLAAPIQHLIEAPMEDNYHLLEAPVEEVKLGLSDDQIKVLCDEPFIIEKVTSLCEVLKKENNERNRFLLVKKFKDEADPRGELLKFIDRKIAEGKSGEVPTNPGT